jgi:hypothetical protein
MPVVASGSGGFLDLDLLRLGPSSLGDFDPQDTFRHGGLDLRVPRFAAVGGPSRNRGRGLLKACRSGWEGVIAKKGTVRMSPGERVIGSNSSASKNRNSSLVVTRIREGIESALEHCCWAFIGGEGSCMPARSGPGFDNDMLQRLGRQLARLETPNCPYGDEQVGGHGVHWSSQRSSLKSASLSGRGNTNCATLDSSACGTTRDRKRSCGKANVCSQRTSASIATHRRHLREWHGVPLQRLRPRQLPRLPA